MVTAKPELSREIRYITDKRGGWPLTQLGLGEFSRLRADRLPNRYHHVVTGAPLRRPAVLPRLRTASTKSHDNEPDVTMEAAEEYTACAVSLWVPLARREAEKEDRLAAATAV